MCPTFWVWRGWAQSLARRATVAPSAATPVRPLARDTPLLYLPAPICCLYTAPSPLQLVPISSAISPDLLFPQKAARAGVPGFCTEHPSAGKLVGARLMFPFLPGSSPDLMTRVEGKEHSLAFLSPHGCVEDSSTPRVTAGHGAGRAGAGAGRLPRPGQPQSQKWVV